MIDSGAETSNVSDAAANQISTDPFPNCYLCGATGTLLYRGLQDCGRGVAGTWDLKQCPGPGCGLVWLDPMPREADIGKAYRSYYTHTAPAAPTASADPPPTLGKVARLQNLLGASYLQGKFGYGLGVGQRKLRMFYPIAKLLFDILPGARDGADGAVCFMHAPVPGARFLEVGFGDSSTLVRMRELGWDVVGIETDPVSVDAARTLGLDARLGGLSTHAFPDATFDAIYASHVLEHVHDPLGVLRECHRILKPRGTVVMTTPNLASWGHHRFGAGWVPLDPPRHVMLFSPRTMRTLVDQAGFSVARVRTTARLAFLYFGMTEVNRRLGSLANQVGPWPTWVVRRAYIQHVIENLLMLVNPHAGDELLLIAKK
jgi:SAM-dependent methyltransferase